MIKKNFFTKNKGQMLIEIVIAVGIIGLVLVGISDLMTRSIKVVTFQKQKDEALTIIKKKLIEYQTARDSDPNGFFTAMVNGTTTLNPCVSDMPLYKCEITQTKISADSANIIVVVKWDEGGLTFSTSLSQSLSRKIK